MGINFTEYFYIISIEKDMSFFEVTGDTVNVQEKQEGHQYDQLVKLTTEIFWTISILNIYCFMVFFIIVIFCLFWVTEI